jgi:cobalt-zinc-cadmium efflux system membrane fusion protein
MNRPRAQSLALLFIALVVACRESTPIAQKESPRSPPSALEVDVSLVGQGRVALGQVELAVPRDELRAIGYVEPDVTAAADVGALVLSRVRDLLVREGDRVEKGQLLAELDAPDAARVAAELGRAASERARAERALARERRLMVSRATSQRELEQAEAELGSLVAEERAARMLLDAYGASGSRIRVRAPVGGILTHVGVELGARVEAGNTLFRVVDPARFIVRAEVLERDARRVERDAPVVLLFPDGKRCDASVIALGAEVERLRHTVSVRLAPKECELTIAGQVLDVRILASAGSGPKLASVPRDAVVELDGAPAVFVAGDAPGRFALFPVIVSRFTETTAFLEKGPAPGTRVAVKGTILLKGEWMRASLE